MAYILMQHVIYLPTSGMKFLVEELKKQCMQLTTNLLACIDKVKKKALETPNDQPHLIFHLAYLHLEVQTMMSIGLD